MAGDVATTTASGDDPEVATRPTPRAGAGTTLRRARERVRDAVPRGGALPEDTWRRRHRGILVLLWLHVPAVVLFALARGETLAHGLLESAAVAAPALVATSLRRHRRLTTTVAALGLLTASAVLVHLSGGVIEVHFHFFVMVGVIVLYQDWVPFLVAIAYVVLHHGALGALAPEEVYNHSAALNDPWKWAVVHGGFILGMSVAGIAAWRLNEALRHATLEREQQLAEAQQVANLGSWEWEIAADRVTWSDQQYRLFGVEPDEFHATYQSVLSRVERADRQLFDDTISRAYRDCAGFALDFRVVLPGGEVRWLHGRGDVVEASGGRPVRMCGTTQDITERKQGEQALRTSEERYRRIVETTRDGVWMLDAGHRTTFVNGRMAEMLGHEVDEMLGTTLFDHMHAEDRALARGTFVRRAAAGEDQHDYRFRRKDGTELWALVSTRSLLDDDDSFAGALAMVSDITARKRAEQQLAHQALHDPLTGLPNRALLFDRLDQGIRRSERSDRRLAVLFLDLDRFKVVNDGLGHSAGDQLLVAVAHRLRSAARPMDTVARFGGDEFVVLCEDLPDEDAASALAERLATTIRQPVSVGEREVTVTVSTGIATAKGRGAEPEALLRDADAAMYQAKERGRARHEVFDAVMRNRVVERLETEGALRRALERGELRLVYQPEVSLRDGSVTGVEALLRWEHPERGLLGPEAFISLAEETGLIVPIGSWVLVEACRRLQQWQADHAQLSSLVVWVNLSARQLAEPDLTDVVAKSLAEAGLDPAHLGLELTESAVMQDTEAVGVTLARLKALGVQVAVDDFGTGFSSMNYLKQFPVDILKVDRSFVAGLGRDPGDSAIVAAVIGLAQSLGLAAIAEGVETFEQLAALHALGCDRAQGYYFSRPQPAAAMERALVERVAAGSGSLGGGVGEGGRRSRAVAPARVLVCDDEETTRFLYRTAFEEAGALVAEAADGDQCLAVAARQRPDLVLLDALMPNRDGLSVLADLRRLHPSATVVVVTAFRAGEVVERSRALGADDCMDKVSLLTNLDQVVDDYVRAAAGPAVPTTR